MRKIFSHAVVFLFALLPVFGHAQSTISGNVTDSAGNPLKGVAVSLLYPKDSTMAFFGITDASGRYLIQYIASGNYLLQAASMNFRTHYQSISIPLASGSKVPVIKMQSVKAMALEGVQVKSEKIPIILKKDTVEYNAGSFKTKPDAVVQELLKKLPGVEVDKAGNIKAGGKDVQKVLVDGKEFFSDDHKVATKNLPADAIDKVQVFDGLSQQAQYTGIDDGERDRTINLMLKEDKRKGYFGDVQGGVGTDERFKLSGHYYRFKKKSQLAALGTLNNINQFGFTLQDYISFSGGLNAIMNGGGNELSFGSNSPVNFGQQVTGLITSGAAGLNYTYESKSGRYNASYIGNGADKQLNQTTLSQNFTENGTFTRDEILTEQKKDFNQSLNCNIRQDLDSFQQLRFSGGLSYSEGNASRRQNTSSLIQSAMLNQLDSRLENEGDGLTASGNLSYTKRSKGKWASIRFALAATLEKNLSNNEWHNTTTFYQPSAHLITDNQYQDNQGSKSNYTGSISASRKLGKYNFLEPEIRTGRGTDQIRRHQGLAGNKQNDIDSLSPSYQRRYDFIRPGLTFRHGTPKQQYSVSVRAEKGSLTSMPDESGTQISARSYLLPAAFWQYNIATSTSINVNYSSSVQAPTARQMLPATDYTNPIQRIHGNPSLLPEYQHNVRFGFHRFEAFSFTSLMAGFNARYVRDKINLARKINQDLSEDATYGNTPEEYNLSGRCDYSTPVRKLGINISIGLTEQYNKGMSLVNDALNMNNTWTHSGKLGLSNRKKEHWDGALTLSVSYTDSRYSVQQSLNSSFLQLGADAELSYRPNDALFFSIQANVDRYQSGSFPDALTIPLLQASASYYCLRGRRAAFTLEGFDLLDRNRSIQRSSQLNYLIEQRSNSIGQYVLLSFKYRLSATGGGEGPRSSIHIVN